MDERILVPLNASNPPARDFVCIAGAGPAARGEPTFLGQTVPTEYLDRPLRDYLEHRAHELSAMGTKASPLAVQGSAAERVLDFAESSDTSIFVVSMHGPYRIQHARGLEAHFRPTHRVQESRQLRNLDPPLRPRRNRNPQSKVSEKDG